MTEQPLVRVVSGDASPTEVAAIAAALSAILQERDARAAAIANEAGHEQLGAWLRTSRLTARRAGLMRGPWRLSGRIGRRSRA